MITKQYKFINNKTGAIIDIGKLTFKDEQQQKEFENGIALQCPTYRDDNDFKQSIDVFYQYIVI